MPNDQIPKRDHRERRHHSQARRSPWTTLWDGVGHHQYTDGLSSPPPTLARTVSIPAGGPPARDWLWRKLTYQIKSMV